MSKIDVQPFQSVRALDKRSFIPLYSQIQRTLMEKIRSGELSEGDLLASEEELARLYRVSRMTARQALQGLKSSGYAVSHRGRGTFVTRPKLEKNIMRLQGFTEDMKQRGMVPTSRLIEQTVMRPPDELVHRLHLKPDDFIMRLRRLRIADEIPMAVEESNIPLKHYPGLERIGFEHKSLYAVLRDRYGLRVGWADETIEALPATREESLLLTIPNKACVLSISRLVMTTEDIPIEVASSRYRGDRYRAFLRVPASTGD